MTFWFVTRHPGAVDWAARHGLKARLIEHLDPDTISPGDTVAGSLPVHLAGQVCDRGGRYLHLELHVPPDLRGAALDADTMERLGARLTEFRVSRVGEVARPTPPNQEA
jgi:CRISPR-associated protein Csx16